MKVSILTENTVYKRGFLGEHGMSLLIETGQRRYLFDTGQSHVFLHNASKLQVALEDVDGIILSHGHYDHCGGMDQIQELAKKIPVYVQERAFEKKYTENPKTGELRYIGLKDQSGWQECGMLRKLPGGFTKISDGVYLVSEIPYVTEFESLPLGFWRECIQEQGPELLADFMEDEQLLVIEESPGLCVFAGCAHPGIINCLHHVQSVLPGKPVRSLIAGMHLKAYSKQRVDETICALAQMQIEKVVPLHCTGIRAMGAIKEALGDRCILPEAGKQITI